jgi:predicted phosphodiesterase
MREIFVSDIHFPFHHKPAFHVLLKVMQYRQPDIVHLGGDIVDFHSISRHPKQLADRTLLKFEVDEAKKELARLRKAAPSAEFTYQEGNHDSRLAVYLRDRAPELADLVEIEFPRLLKLDDLGMKWVPELENCRVGKLWHHHGHLIPGAGRNPAKAKFNATHTSLIFGHHHVFDYYSVRQYGTKELFQAAANACLYTLEPEYALVNHWHIGFSEIAYIQSGEFDIKQQHIHTRPDGSAYTIIDGIEFTATADEDIDKYLAAAAKRLPNRKRRQTESN